MTNRQSAKLTESRNKSYALRDKHPDIFMICPRCDGKKVIEETGWDPFARIEYFRFVVCTYCSGNGVVASWIDDILKGIKR